MEKVEWVGVCVPVCCAWEQTVRMSISAPVWSMCVTLCLSDGQSKHPWVGAVCASLSRCSALQWVTWLLCSSPHCSLCTLSYLAFFICPPPPSFYRYPVVSPPFSSPMFAFNPPHSSLCTHLSFTDTWAHWFAVWMGQYRQISYSVTLQSPKERWGGSGGWRGK